MSRVLLVIRELGSNHKYHAAVRICAAFVLVVILLGYTVFASYSDNVNKGLADNLIRLHVLANSDSREDQALKRDVRDAVLNYMVEKLKNSRDIEQTRFLINTNMNAVKEIVNDVIVNNGRNYGVDIMLGSYPFPTKTYGDITLPAGYYQALRIVIGKGEGSNWWCVLFPPLCFVDVSHGTVPESVKRNLKNTLTKEEYSIIASAEEDGDIPVKIRFKVVEFFQDSKVRFTGMINRIFKSTK